MSFPPPEAVAAAVRHMLTTAPDRWAAFDPDQLSEPEYQVLLRLHAFRLIERRATFVCTSPAAPGVVRGVSQATGLPPIPFEGAHNLIGAFAAVWEDARKEWVARHPAAPFPIVSRADGCQWRITGEGLEARGHSTHDLDVVTFVLFGQSVHETGGVRGYFRIVDVSVDGAAHHPVTLAPSAVTVANWAEGAATFADALSGLVPRTAGSGTTDRQRGNRPLEETDAAKLNVYRLIHAANTVFEPAGGKRKGRPTRFLSHLTSAAEHKQLRESITEAGLTLSLELIRQAVDTMTKKGKKPAKPSRK